MNAEPMHRCAALDSVQTIQIDTSNQPMPSISSSSPFNQAFQHELVDDFGRQLEEPQDDEHSREQKLRELEEIFSTTQTNFTRTDTERYAIQSAVQQTFLGKKTQRSEPLEEQSTPIKRISAEQQLINDIKAIGGWTAITNMQGNLGLINREDFNNLTTWCSLGGKQVHGHLLHNVARIQKGRGMMSEEDFNTLKTLCIRNGVEVDVPLLSAIAEDRLGQGMYPKTTDLEQVRMRLEALLSNRHLEAEDFSRMSPQTRDELKRIFKELADRTLGVNEAVQALEQELGQTHERLFKRYRKSLLALPSFGKSKWAGHWCNQQLMLLSSTTLNATR